MLNKLFNWKRHPSSVFFFAGPVAAIGFALVFARAILELKHHGDPWYLVIALGGVVLLCVGLWPIRKPLLNILYSKD